MTILVDVHLLSGRGVTLATEADDSVLALKKRAQSAFAVAGGRVVDLFRWCSERNSHGGTGRITNR